mgnify:CR=1 FL=1
MEMVTTLGSQIITAGRAIDEFWKLLSSTFLALLRPPLRIKDIFIQLYFVANQSVVIIVFCVSFAAMVTIIEASFHMKLVLQNDSLVRARLSADCPNVIKKQKFLFALIYRQIQ